MPELLASTTTIDCLAKKAKSKPIRTYPGDAPTQPTHFLYTTHVKKKHRISTAHSHATATTTSFLLTSSSAVVSTPAIENPSNEDDHIDIDEPWKHSYVHLSGDIILHAVARAELHHAQNWRSITMLTSTPPSPILVPIEALPESYGLRFRVRPLHLCQFHPI